MIESADLVRVRAALRACWDEYHELMPAAIYEQVRAALNIRVFTADLPVPSEAGGLPSRSLGDWAYGQHDDWFCERCGCVVSGAHSEHSRRFQ